MPFLLVSDYNQKPLIGGILATADLMGHVKNAARNCKYSKTMSLGKTKGRPIKSNAIFADSSHSAASNSAIGSRILASAKWLELTEAERSKDKEHNALVDKLYEGNQISLDKDLKKYDLWDKEIVKKDSGSKRRRYLSAPVIVKTNRERFTMNILRAHEFAKEHKTVVIKWQSEYSTWEGKPSDPRDEANALNDPAFWEFFVRDGPCYLTNTVCRKKRLCNGTRCKYHSLILTDSCQQIINHEMATARPGSIITLPEPPLGINISIANVANINRSNIDWENYSVDDKAIAVTIRRRDAKPSRPMPIQTGSLLCSPS